MTQHAPAKINAFLKITAKRGDYHEMVSRFIKIETLFDLITFTPKESLEPFKLIGDFGCPLEKNTIYKAYQALYNAVKDDRIIDYFTTHAVAVTKNIPSFAGLGGGSSDAATFLKMANSAIGLGLSPETLASVGIKVGADVPFFIYDYKVANIQGIGEIVTEFKEPSLPSFEIITPDTIACDTVAVFQNFRKKFYKAITAEDALKLLQMPTLDVLDKFCLEEANDLYLAALDLYPALAEYAKEPWYFSGSGSSFFRVKE